MIAVLLLAPAARGDDAGDGRRAPTGFAFTSTAVDGQPVTVEPSAEPRLTVVCFLGCECPLARLYGPRLNRLAFEFGLRGVRVIGVNSNQQDSVADIQRYVTEYQLKFPFVRDDKNQIADQYRAERTPEVFVLDQFLNVRYRGRIDDQYEPGVTRPAPTREDLRRAIEELLAGEPVSVPVTEASGCFIGKISPQTAPFVEPTTITYSKEISRVLQKHCVECHRAGEIGPFSLETFEDAVSWADTIVEVIDNGRMPPWHADPNVGHFANARNMPEPDKQLVRDWVRSGRPQGDPKELAPTPTFTDGWQLPRQPDVVLSMRDRPYRVPANGIVEYQYFVVDPKFTEDRWVTAAQVIPGARQVVHHAIVFVRPPDGSQFRGIGWLTGYVPGQRLMPLPSGYARRVPAGSKLVFQMHYTTNGIEQADVSQVGIVFADAADVTHEVLTLIGLEQDFEIPPHAPNHEVLGEIRGLSKEASLLAIIPHMHYRGKSFRLVAEAKGKESTLLNVPDYRFDWQHAYVLQEPLPLSNIDRLRFSAVFDNSKENPFNPDPTQRVTWGDQSWEEMAVAFCEIAEPLDGATSVARVSEKETPSDDRAQKIKLFVDEFFEKLDTNRDGVVRRSEVPLAVRRVSFSNFDYDNDDEVSKDEVRRKAEERF